VLTLSLLFSPDCGRSSAREQRSQDHFQLPPAIDHPVIGPVPQILPGSGSRRTMSLAVIRSLEDEINAFRRIHIIENTKAIESLEEAEEILLLDPANAKALQFKGWWLLTHNDPSETKSIEKALFFLKKSASSGTYADVFIRMNDTLKC
jgi:hypothetical protein